MTLSPTQLRKMQQGRERARRQAERDAVARVRAYQRWLKAGSKLRDIPEIPSKGDYKIAQRRGKA